MQTTRRHPRTLEDAFGPYARGPVHPMPEPEPEPLGFRVVIWTCWASFAGLIAMHFAGWLV